MDREGMNLRDPLIFLRFRFGLFAGDDGIAGANFSARTALDAGVGIDVVDVAFGDSFNGTYGLAGATSHAGIGNYVSHCSKI